jgi:hypothetical protein
MDAAQAVPRMAMVPPVAGIFPELGVNAMNNNDTPLSIAAAQADANDVGEFHDAFDAEARNIMERAREALLEGPFTCSREEIIAQIIMEEMFAHPCDPGLPKGADVGYQTTDMKASLVRIAGHLGPDWAQALYHAAVFITKVA